MEQQLVPREVAKSPAERVLGPARARGIPVPAGPHDWGLFGPDSVSWRVHSNPVLLVGGLRALIIQSLNPLAMAGIDQHSNYLARPLARLRRTAEYVAAVVYGDTASAHRAAEMVQRLHARVHGTDPITGSPYSAADTQTKLWVHCVEVHSFLAAYRAYGARMHGVRRPAAPSRTRFSWTSPSSEGTGCTLAALEARRAPPVSQWGTPGSQ